MQMPTYNMYSLRGMTVVVQILHKRSVTHYYTTSRLLRTKSAQGKTDDRRVLTLYYSLYESCNITNNDL